MELILIYGCAILLSILAISIFYLSNSITYANPGLPPGKTGLPLIGESIEFISNLQKGNLERFNFRRMVKYNTRDVFKTSVLGDHMAMLCGTEASKFLFSPKANKMVKRWFPRPIQRISYPTELHVSLDRYVRPAFHVSARLDVLKTFVPGMDAMAQHHLESHWRPQQVIEVYPSVKQYAFAVACRLLLSIEDPDVVKSIYVPMETWALGFHSMPINLPGTQLSRSLKAGDVLGRHIQQIVRQRRSESDSQKHKDSLLSHIIQACEDDKTVSDCSLGILLASHETVTSAISMILKVIRPCGNHPDVYRSVYQEIMEIGKPGELLTWEDIQKMKYTWNVAREVMRLYPPAAFITRETMTDFTYAGHHIPQGYKLMTNIHAIHKDPMYFKKPEDFDPSRFDGEGPLPFTYMTFGGGQYMCPGMNFAKLVILVFIHNVVRRFKWETVVADEKVIGIPAPRPSKGLPIIIHPHSN